MVRGGLRGRSWPSQSSQRRDIPGIGYVSRKSRARLGPSSAVQPSALLLLAQITQVAANLARAADVSRPKEGPEKVGHGERTALGVLWIASIALAVLAAADGAWIPVILVMLGAPMAIWLRLG